MSRGVAPGGVMSLPKASYSKETQEMLKRELVLVLRNSEPYYKRSNSDDGRIETDQLPAEEIAGNING